MRDRLILLGRLGRAIVRRDLGKARRGVQIYKMTGGVNDQGALRIWSKWQELGSIGVCGFGGVDDPGPNKLFFERFLLSNGTAT